MNTAHQQHAHYAAQRAGQRKRAYNDFLDVQADIFCGVFAAAYDGNLKAVLAEL